MAGLIQAPAIVVLGRSALATARRIQTALPGATIHGLQARTEGDTDVAFSELGEHLRGLYAQGTPIVALCAAGITIRCVAPMLANKGVEPPVLAVAEDGSAVVPLLGGLAGVNVLARQIADALAVAPAITTSGELRYGTCLLNPPDGYVLADLEQSKHFVSDLLAGESLRIDGDAPWLADAALPHADTATHTLRITPQLSDGRRGEMVIHPRSVVAVVASATNIDVETIRLAMAAHTLSPRALAAVLAPAALIGQADLDAAATALGVPLRFVAQADDETVIAAIGNETRIVRHGNSVSLAIATAPINADAIGRARGTLTVIGLGPGCDGLRVPDATRALAEATDVLGYATYTDMAGPFRDDQRVHATDNREELMRARHAFELASEGKRAVVVSSGDPGVFAMAAAVLEALDTSDVPAWKTVDLRIVPGISAAMATAAQAGAPLGHDFCMLSLSDNLKPWQTICDRLNHAAQADLVMAFYNPVSRARPWQLDEALQIVRNWRAPETRVVLGRDVARCGAKLTTTTLGDLRSDQVDMRTMVIIGSSTTRGIDGGPHGEWIYTPRWYGEQYKK